MDTCSVCFAQIRDEDVEAHSRWHAAYLHHRHDCPKLLTAIAQTRTGAYIARKPCTCDIEHLHELLLDEL